MCSDSVRIFYPRSEHQIAEIIGEISALDLSKKWRVEITDKAKRTVQQNDLYWAYMTELGQQIGCTKEQAGLIAKSELGLAETVMYKGLPKLLVKSTMELSVKEMSDFIREIEIWAPENGFTLYAPNYREEALK